MLHNIFGHNTDNVILSSVLISCLPSCSCFVWLAEGQVSGIMWSSETVPQDAHKICSCTQNCCWTPHMPQTRTHYKNKQTAHSSLDWWNWEGIKPGTEPEVNAAQCGRGHRICYGNCQAYFAFCTCHDDGTSTQQTAYSHIKHMEILTVYLKSSSGVADSSLTSEGSVMSLPSLSYSWFSRGE